MVFEKFINLNNPRTEKSVVGLTKVQFLKLSEFFEQAYHDIQSDRLINGEIRRLPKGGALGVLDTPQKMLFFILYYMKTYCTFDVLGFTFGFSSGHAHDPIKRIFPVLKRTLLTLDALPVRTISSVEELMQLIKKHGKIILDGVERSCVRPQNDDAQKAHYSGKKNSMP
jgi:Helix-turn-helix of DDE superfamily endonuclease